MRMVRLALAHCYVATAVFGIAMVSSVSGCGGSNGDGEVVVPEQPFAESAKGSMDFYKAEMAKNKKGSKKK